MKLLVDISSKLLEEVIQVSGSKTKKQAVITSMTEYLALQKRRALAGMIGNYEYGGSLKGLKKRRKSWARS